VVQAGAIALDHSRIYPRRIVESRIEAFKEEDDDDFADRDIMHDIKAELKPMESFEEDGEGNG